MPRRLLAVHAHPDDESSKGAASYAYYAAHGAEVMIVTCTGGERGDVLNHEVADLPMADRDLSGLRRIEMAGAQAILKVRHRWLGYTDSGMPSHDGSVPFGSFAGIDEQISVRPLVKVIREFRPQVMTTYDENGGYPHPDHIRTHVISVLAYELAADPDYAPELGEAWSVSKLYYDETFNSTRMQAIYKALIELDPDSAAVKKMQSMSHWLKEAPYTATTQVPIAGFLDARDAALRSHASQVPPDSFFFFLPNEIQEKAWPYEDYRLAKSRVDTQLPENDLFASIQEAAR